MSREFNPITPRARALVAGIAVLAAAVVVWSVLALAGHYDDEFLRVSKAQAAAATQHAQAPKSAKGAHADHG
jgi:hypothetical protein